MTAASRVLGPLQPRPWHPGEPPPQAAPAGRWPLLLLIDRRAPLVPEQRRALAATLTSQERQRHHAFRLEADRERFLLGRSALRRWLGAWLDLEPAAVPIVAGPQGKPHCPEGPQFNVSHSGELILLALHPSRPVGVDVEQARPGLDWQAIAGRVLPPDRLSALRALPGDQQALAFLVEWCRLEAQLKALGTGLGGMSALAGAGAALELRDLALPAGHVGAVALAAPIDVTGRPAGAAVPRCGNPPA